MAEEGDDLLGHYSEPGSESVAPHVTPPTPTPPRALLNNLQGSNENPTSGLLHTPPHSPPPPVPAPIAGPSSPQTLATTTTTTTTTSALPLPVSRTRSRSNTPSKGSSGSRNSIHSRGSVSGKRSVHSKSRASSRASSRGASSGGGSRSNARSIGRGGVRGTVPHSGRDEEVVLPSNIAWSGVIKGLVALENELTDRLLQLESDDADEVTSGEAWRDELHRALRASKVLAATNLFSLAPDASSLAEQQEWHFGLVTGELIETLAVLTVLSKVVMRKTTGWTFYLGYVNGMGVVVTQCDRLGVSWQSSNAAHRLHNLWGVRAVIGIGLGWSATPMIPPWERDSAGAGPSAPPPPSGIFPTIQPKDLVQVLVGTRIQPYDHYRTERMPDGTTTKITLSQPVYVIEKELNTLKDSLNQVVKDVSKEASATRHVKIGLLVSSSDYPDAAKQSEMIRIVKANSDPNHPRELLGGEQDMSGIITACEPSGVVWTAIKGVPVVEHPLVRATAALEAMKVMYGFVHIPYVIERVRLPSLRVLQVEDDSAFVNEKARGFVGRAGLTEKMETFRDYGIVGEEEQQTMLMVVGPPGVGKTAWVASLVLKDGCRDYIAAHHFCRFDHPDTLDTRRVAGSLTRQLLAWVTRHLRIDVSGAGAPASSGTIEESEILARVLTWFLPKSRPDTPDEELKQLLMERRCIPRTVKEGGGQTTQDTHLLLIVDSLDEAWESNNVTLVEMLRKAQTVCRQLGWIRILSTMRDDSKIRQELGRRLTFVELSPTSSENRADLSKYVENEVLRMEEVHQTAERGSLAANLAMIVEEVVTKSEFNFLYAKQFLASCNSWMELMDHVKKETLPEGLTAWYNTRFAKYMVADGEYGSEVKQTLRVLGNAQGPLPRSILKVAAGHLGVPDALAIVRDRLSSVVANLSGDRVRIYHRSFQDWLNIQYERESPTTHQALWDACLSVWKESHTGPAYEYAGVWGVTHGTRAGLMKTDMLEIPAHPGWAKLKRDHDPTLEGFRADLSACRTTHQGVFELPDGLAHRIKPPVEPEAPEETDEGREARWGREQDTVSDLLEYGRALQELGMYWGAIALYEKVAERPVIASVEHQRITAEVNRSICLIRLHEAGEEARPGQAPLHLQARHWAYFALIHSRELGGSTRLAVRARVRALASANMGAMYLAVKDMYSAEHWLRAAETAYAELPKVGDSTLVMSNVRMNLATVFRREGKTDLALQMVNKAIASYTAVAGNSSYHFAKLLTQKAEVYKQMGSTEGALSMYSRALELAVSIKGDALTAQKVEGDEAPGEGKMTVADLSFQSKLYAAISSARHEDNGKRTSGSAEDGAIKAWQIMSKVDPDEARRMAIAMEVLRTPAARGGLKRESEKAGVGRRLLVLEFVLCTLSLGLVFSLRTVPRATETGEDGFHPFGFAYPELGVMALLVWGSLALGTLMIRRSVNPVIGRKLHGLTGERIARLRRRSARAAHAGSRFLLGAMVLSVCLGVMMFDGRTYDSQYFQTLAIAMCLFYAYPISLLAVWFTAVWAPATSKVDEVLRGRLADSYLEQNEAVGVAV